MAEIDKKKNSCLRKLWIFALHFVYCYI